MTVTEYREQARAQVLQLIAPADLLERHARAHQAADVLIAVVERDEQLRRIDLHGPDVDDQLRQLRSPLSMIDEDRARLLLLIEDLAARSWALGMVEESYIEGGELDRLEAEVARLKQDVYRAARDWADDAGIAARGDLGAEAISASDGGQLVS